MDREAPEATRSVGSSFDVENIVLLINPHSSRFDAMRPYIDELRESQYGGSRIQEIETDKQHSITEARLLETVKENDCLIVVGGDGSKHIAASAIAKHYPNNGVKLLFVPGGHANDLSYGVHGSGQLPPLSHILDNGRIVRVRPIEVSTSLGVKKSHDIALGYVGIGMTALAAQTLNSWPYRSRLASRDPLVDAVGEAFVAAKSILQSRPFQIEHNGRFKYVYEILFTNGPRVAKYFHFPIKLEDDRIFMTKIETNSRFRKIASMVGNVLLKQTEIDGEVLYGETSVTVYDDELIQLDGETRALHPGTHMIFKQSDNSIELVTYPKPKSEAA